MPVPPWHQKTPKKIKKNARNEDDFDYDQAEEEEEQQQHSEEWDELSRVDVVEYIVDTALEAAFRSMVEVLEQAYVPDSRISLWCRDEIVRQVVSTLWSQHIPSLRNDL